MKQPTARNDWSALVMLRTAFRYRKVLWATSRVELFKKYAGSVLGPLWLVIFPFLLLSIYLFMYVVVFPGRVAGLTGLDFGLFVFTGLVPFLGLVDVLGTGTPAVKQNIHLVKNVMLPIELIPIRSVIVGIVSQMVSLAILIGLIALHRGLSIHFFWLPGVIALETMFLLGLVYFLSAVAVSLSDVSNFVNLFLMMLMFVSPIGYVAETLPRAYWPIVYLNPVFYLIEMFRASLFYGRAPAPALLLIFASMCLATYMAGAAFFGRFKDVLVDYE